MRVLLTTDTIGGVWTFTSELATELLRSGHEVALVSFGREPLTWQRDWCAETSSVFGNCFQTQASGIALEWMQDNEAVFENGSRVLLDMCDRFSPDVLHSSQFCWGALDTSAPVIVTAHSDVRSWAHACRPQGLEESRWLRRYRQLVQDGLDGADAVAAPTAWMSEALQENFRVRTGVQVIANGRTVCASDRGRTLQAVSAGRLWDEAKGLATLLNVSSPVPIIVAGESGDLNEHTGALTFSGALSSSAALDLFSESSIYIAASIYEPFGLAPLEAALCGCAIVARDLPTFREVWGDAVCYFRSEAELESILRHFAGRPEELKAAGIKALNQARLFSSERMTRHYVSLYSSLCCTSSTQAVCRNQEAAYAS